MIHDWTVVKMRILRKYIGASSLHLHFLPIFFKKREKQKQKQKTKKFSWNRLDITSASKKHGQKLAYLNKGLQ